MQDQPEETADTKRYAPGDAVRTRRDFLKDNLKLDFDETLIPPGSMGLALSGGGIRSATISLGFVQAITRHKRLLDFDYLSTVSGGGYFGSFLRSLFVPDDDRGLKTAEESGLGPDAKRIQAFVEEVLSYDAKQELIDDPYTAGEHGSSAQAFTPDRSEVLSTGGPPQKKPQIRNPIWWLREHGRYLAPNGPTDYGYAVAYLIRNWLALLYTFTIAAATVFLALLVGQWAMLRHWPQLIATLHVATTLDHDGLMLSPLLLLPPIFLFLSLASGVSYWLTVSLRTGSAWNMSKANGGHWRPVGQFTLQWLLVLLVTGLAVGLLFEETNMLEQGWSHAIAHLIALPWQWWLLPLGITLSTTSLLIALTVAARTICGSSGDAFTNELRRRLTVLGALFNRLAAICFALALIDTLALALLGPGLAWLHAHRLAGLLAILVPGAAWLITKLPQWFAGGVIVKFLGEHVWTVALVVGALMFGLVALGADVAVHWIAWNRAPWSSPLDIACARFASLGSAIVLLFVMTGSFSGFINLSSLYSLYFGRLTRAYLGASNIARLRAAARDDAKPITENDPKDYIDISRYQRSPSAAPIHLINATLNETHNHARSQLIDRDRKGVPIVFAPDGILVDAARAATLNQYGFFPWDKLKEEGVESLSVGDLCAISGAAASSAMGSRTTLGGALAFTFANIRLGYWWIVRDLLPEAKKMNEKALWRLYVFATRPFRTYFYLWNEMTAAYTRENKRVYLTDGGHFENSGTYELLRREVKVIVTCDNGADPNFHFEDLEDLVRKARIDIGLSVNVADQERVRQLVGTKGAGLFLNGDERDWRVRATTKRDTGCALLLEIFSAAKHATKEQGYVKAEPEGIIIWVKPRVFAGLTPDVTGYGERNPTFPQQTTGDQFFDEAQWESYRALGYSLGDALLTESDYEIDLFRAMLPGWPRKGGSGPDSDTTPRKPSVRRRVVTR